MLKPDALTALAALAQETRLDVYRLLVRAGLDGATPGTLAAALGVSAPTLSFHLKELKHAGLVECRRAGRSLVYGANFDAMQDLVQFLSENCCQGVDECGAAETADAAPATAAP